ncbi:hypothetical protein, partial [Pseudoalteromonas sp. SG44-5]|uniref:hypothetical protein n=1 Tax=Pseudoalteromonas sp. SG44-5 TaxID=2760960 RepID=UPI001C71E137
ALTDTSNPNPTNQIPIFLYYHLYKPFKIIRQAKPERSGLFNGLSFIQALDCCYIIHIPGI